MCYMLMVHLYVLLHASETKHLFASLIHCVWLQNCDHNLIYVIAYTRCERCFEAIFLCFVSCCLSKIKCSYCSSIYAIQWRTNQGKCWFNDTIEAFIFQFFAFSLSIVVYRVYLLMFLLLQFLPVNFLWQLF